MKRTNSNGNVSRNHAPRETKTRVERIPYAHPMECIPFNRLCSQLQKLTDDVEKLNQRYNHKNCSIERIQSVSNSLNQC